MKKLKRKLALAAASVVMGVAVAGCATNTGNGELAGGAIGAGLGAIIGHASHGNTVGGAVVGGAIGALTGGAIGNEVDRQQAAAAAAGGAIVEPAPPPPVIYYSPPPPPPPGYYYVYSEPGRYWELRAYPRYYYYYHY